ncbi:glycosyltransferase [Clostridium sp. HBUAS56010]|uniref:glycosyltransferase family 2 protein n=1 Tax=Clostridium sp. HBUAS56010 TaxID=2571127 RepID=UPI0011780433|nr:glycosyltransferase [Clostridium sp. HBUAS56010]
MNPIETLLPEINSPDENESQYNKVIKLQEFLTTASCELHISLCNGSIDYSKSHLKIISIALSELEPFCEDPKMADLPVSYSAMFKNIKWTLEKIREFMENNLINQAQDMVEFQLIPFFKEWKEDTYFWLTVYPDKEKMKQYYKEEFIPNHKNTYENRGEKYLVSIFIPVYNKLEYTKKCLESLMRNTDLSGKPWELILLNDGSSDGTEEYFKELGIRKIITLKENVKTMIFSLMYRVCEGKYAAFVNNDTILTSNWLNNLLTCIQSSPDIISVAPSTPNTSNRQGMVADFTPENAEETGKKHNTPTPYLWEERCRLMPVIALYDVEKVNSIGFADRFFYTLEFWDDDFSLRARRAGYKQILCKDTWCYHFGSVSGKEGQVRFSTLQNGRNLFIKKHGVDPWGNNFCYDPYLLEHLESTFSHQPHDTPVLGIDPGYGADVIQLRTSLKRLGKRTSFSFAISEPDLLDDLAPLDATVLVSKNNFELHKNIPQGEYQYIIIGKDLSLYPDYRELLNECTQRLKPGGVLSFYVNNPYGLHIKKELEEERLLNEKHSLTLIPISEPLFILNKPDLSVKVKGILEPNLPAELKKDRTEHLNRYFVLVIKAE